MFLRYVFLIFSSVVYLSYQGSITSPRRHVLRNGVSVEGERSREGSVWGGYSLVGVEFGRGRARWG